MPAKETLSRGLVALTICFVVGCGSSGPQTQTIPPSTNAAGTVTADAPQDSTASDEAPAGKSSSPSETTPAETTPAETTSTTDEPAPDSGSEDDAVLPTEATSFEVHLSGETAGWNSETEDYDPIMSFDRDGTLIVEPSADGDGYDVGIFSGSFADATAGALHFVSNSYVLRHIDSVADFNWQAQIPVARVEADPSGSISVKMDTSLSRTVQLNNIALGNTPAPKEIVDGSLELELADDGTVSGQLELFANGYIEPGNSFPVYKLSADVSG